MSAPSYIYAMPKVEVNLHLEGGIHHDTLVTIAEQNDIPYTFKQYAHWKKQLERPNFAKLDDLISVTSKWILHPEDFSRIAYEIGVYLAKQNVRYAEVGVNPLLYMENGLTFEQLLNALNDGRERVEKGWPIKLNWILSISPAQIRKADDVIRWVTSASAKKGNVVGMALTGGTSVQILGEFERPLHTAQKKGIPCSIELADDPSVIRYGIEHLNPDRIILMTPKPVSDAMKLLSDTKTLSSICLTKALRLGLLSNYSDIPIRQLIEDGMMIGIASEMPYWYSTSLEQEFEAAYAHCALNIADLENIAVNGALMCFLPDEEKQSLIQSMQNSYMELRDQHQVSDETSALTGDGN
jgi:adenosine deaminase